MTVQLTIPPKSSARYKKTIPKRSRLLLTTPIAATVPPLKSGFYNSRYQWIALTDADGQFDFSDIHHLIKNNAEPGLT